MFTKGILLWRIVIGMGELTDLTKVYESPVVQIEIRRRGQINYSLP